MFLDTHDKLVINSDVETNLRITMTSLICSPDDTEAAEPEIIRLKLIQAEEAAVKCQHQQYEPDEEEFFCGSSRLETC